MRRQRVLRRLLRKYRDAKKITKDIYHKFYLGSKGNQFKNKTVLIEAIHRMKQEKIREKQLVEQREARRAKNNVRKDKRVAKKLEQLGGYVAQQAAPKAAKNAPVKEDKKPVAPKKEEKKPKQTTPAPAAPVKTPAAPAKEEKKPVAAPAKAAPKTSVPEGSKKDVKGPSKKPETKPAPKK